MRVQHIYLFKVPFDNTYKNVFDFAESNIPNKEQTPYRFHQFLIENFPYMEFNLDGTKSIKSINESGVLTLPILAAEMREWNYIEFLNYDARQGDKVIENWRRFYFITDVTSENDGVPTMSSSINIEFDVWHNNLGELQDVNNFDENYVERCHQSRFVNTGRGLRRIYSTTPEDFGEFAVKRSYVESKYKVLWLCLQFDDGIEFGAMGELAQPTSAIPTITGTPIAYLPYLFINDGVLEKFKYTTTNLFSNRPDLTIDMFPSSRFLKKISSILTNTHLINATLTYLTPFEYNITEENGVKLIKIISDEYYGSCAIGGVLSEWNINGKMTQFICGYSDVGFSFSDDLNPIYNYKDTFYLNNNSVLTDYSNIINTNIKHQLDGESKFFNYPFNYYSFVVNDIERNLVCRNLYDTLQLIIEKNCSLTPTVSFFENGVKDVLQSFILENGQCILNKDILQEYWRNNSTKLITKSVSNAIDNISIKSSMMKKYNYLLGVSDNKNFKEVKVDKQGIANDLISTGASLIDMSKQRDIISQPQFIAQNDLKFQNNVRVYKNEVFTEETIDSIIYTFMRYGYNLFCNRSLRKINRYWFDYVKTNNCYLPFIKNYNEREAVQNIYNSGVTKWHIINYIAKIDFDFTINNPEIEFITVTETKLSEPTNLSITYNTLRWDYVENATDYRVYFNGELIFTTKANFLNLVGLIPENSSGYITIIANASGYIDSFASDPIYYSNELQQLSTPIVDRELEADYRSLVYCDRNSEYLRIEMKIGNDWSLITSINLSDANIIDNQKTVVLTLDKITKHIGFGFTIEDDEVFSQLRVRTTAVGYNPSEYATLMSEFDFIWTDVVYNLTDCVLYSTPELTADGITNPNKVPSITNTFYVTVEKETTGSNTASYETVFYEGTQQSHFADMTETDLLYNRYLYEVKIVSNGISRINVGINWEV